MHKPQVESDVYHIPAKTICKGAFREGYLCGEEVKGSINGNVGCECHGYLQDTFLFKTVHDYRRDNW